MSARSRARKRALDILFESELRGLRPGETLVERRAQQAPLNEYTVRLVEGVRAQLDTIDTVIAALSAGWTLQRMPGVDRNILRIGVYELLYVDEVPDAVALSEAVSLAAELSTEDSPSFVNGLLGQVAARAPVLRAPVPPILDGPRSDAEIQPLRPAPDTPPAELAPETRPWTEPDTPPGTARDTPPGTEPDTPPGTEPDAPPETKADTPQSMHTAPDTVG